MILFLICALLLPPICLSYFLVCKTALSRRLTIPASILLFLISQMFTIDMFFFGSLAGPQMPRWLLLLQGGALAAEVLCFLFLLLYLVCTKLFHVPLRLQKTKQNPLACPARRLFLQKTLPALTAPCLAISLAAHGVKEAISIPRIVTHSVPIPNLPHALNGLTIVHISDIHIATITTEDWVDALVSRVNAQNPDLICISGDLSDGLPSYSSADGSTRKQVALHLKNLSARLGVFACCGNHEYYSDYAGWQKIYAACNIRFLNDSAVALEHKNAKIVLGGRIDRQGAAYFGRPVVPAKNIFAAMPESSERCLRILLDHRPERAFENAAVCQLQLSGHTHGGQCLGMDALVQRFNKGFVRGWYTVANMPLYVTTGAGLWNGFPLRLGIPAEIAVLSLTKKDA